MNTTDAPVAKISWIERLKIVVEATERTEADDFWDHIRHLTREIDELKHRMDELNK